MVDAVPQPSWVQLIISHLAALIAGMFLCLALVRPDEPPKRGPTRP